MEITALRLKQLQGMIQAGTSDLFYSWPEWDAAREAAMRLDNRECVRHRARGRFRKAVLVHHVKRLKDRPDLALSLWDGEQRQLVSLCRECHELEHPERNWRRPTPRPEPVTAERWD